MVILQWPLNYFRRPTMALGFLAALFLFGVFYAFNKWLLPVSMPVAGNVELASPQVWGHRGSGGRLAPENTPEAVLVAVREGFTGIELDIFYDPDTDEIIVSHDLPIGGKGNPGISLDAYNIPNTIFVWLDFKNLVSLQEKEVEAFVNKLKSYEFSQNAFVESTNLTNLRLLSRGGIQTVLWLSGWKLRLISLLKYSLNYYGISAVSVDYRSIDAIAGHFSTQSVFTFTLNERKSIDEICKIEQVAVYLTDLPAEQAACATK